jgi:hypothetical protein
MTAELSRALVTPALTTLAAEEGMADVTAVLTAALAQATYRTEPRSESFCVDHQPVVTRSSHGSLTFFLPPLSENAPPRRVAMFDRRGHLLLLCTWTPEGTLARVKVRGLDGRFLGVFRDAASHLGWGRSDSVVLLAGEHGFVIDHTLTIFASVGYENLEFLPPLDAPTSLPVGGGSTILNFLAALGQDQQKTVMRYRGPYPTERLFATLCESFRYSGEPGPSRERFTQSAEERAVQLSMEETTIDWRPSPHERFFPAPDTCVQLRDGVEKVYDRGRTYYRPDLAVNAYALRTERLEEGQTRYTAGLTILGQSVEEHLVLDTTGEIIERHDLAPAPYLRGPTRLSDEWKAVLVRLIATESTPLLRSALWPVVDELTFVWGGVQGNLWAHAGTEIFLHAGIITAFRAAVGKIKSAGEGLLLAARFTSELARLLGPLIRTLAQERIGALSPEAQQVSLLFSSSTAHGVSDNELRAFLSRLVLGEELPTATSS